MIRVPASSYQKESHPERDGFPFGAPAGTRTPDTLLKRQVLYLLSYWGVSSKYALPYVSQLEAQRGGFELEKEERKSIFL